MPDMALKTSKKFVPKCTAAEAIAILLNVSYKLKIDADTLVKIFRGEESPDKWAILLDEFFSDCPLPFIQRFMSENGLTMNDVKNIFFKLPSALQSRKFEEIIASGKLERKRIKLFKW
jgi:hypothetical protein